jgi:hypothetical protein
MVQYLDQYVYEKVEWNLSRAGRGVLTTRFLSSPIIGSIVADGLFQLAAFESSVLDGPVVPSRVAMDG